MRFPIFCCSALLLFTSSLRAQKPATDRKVITGTVLVNDHTPFDFKAFSSALKSEWSVRPDSFNQAEKTLVLYMPDATVMLAYLDYPAAPAEIRQAAEGAWLWKGAAEEAPRHQAQVVVSVIGSPQRALYLYKLYTRVVAAALDNTRSCGVYLASQLLLQSKTFFLQAARSMDTETLPVYCWIYFGMFQSGDGSNGYSYGLSEFGMPDLEINRSKHSLQEVHAIIYDAVSNALLGRTSLRDGAVIETLEGQKLTLKLSKASYWEGQTLKAEY